MTDIGNSRIQRFRSGEKNGTTVAGLGIPRNLNLNNPTDVVLDADDFLYIVDRGNSRVIRVGQGDYQCIAGCLKTNGLTPYELNRPESIRFDSLGNIYIADTDNHRIQKFILFTNSCGK